NFSGDLEIGIEKESTLKQETAESYQIQVDSNAFITGYVNQKTVDVVVKLFNEDDEEIGNIDSPARGLEHFSFTIDKTGNYRIEVEPFKEESGDYSIKINAVEAIATEPSQRVDQLLSYYSGNEPGAVVGVFKDGKLTFSKAYGKANLTHDLDFDLNMPTNIGSVSKQFTTFAILLLEKQDLLSTEDDIRKHIPEFPEFDEVIKVKNLMNHTNGLREVYNLMPITGWNGEDKLLRDEVLNMLNRQTKLQVGPGEEFNYNNSAFILLADLVERKTDMDFPTWMKENVFDPLGMSDTRVRRNPSEIIPRATQGYIQDEHGLVEAGDLHAAYGAGGIYTTPNDLAKWLNNFDTKTLGGEALLNKLVTPEILKNGDTLDYAFGIGIGEHNGLKRYAHTGADIAHRAAMYYYPEIKAGVIALSNNGSFGAGGIASDIAEIYFKDHFTEDETEAETPSEEAASFTVSEDLLKNYVGKYKAASIGLIIEYKLEEGQLIAYPVGQSSLKLIPTSEHVFKYETIDATVTFNLDSEDISNTAVHVQGGSDFELVRIPDFDPSLEELEMYTGKFYCDELETFYTLKIKDSSLIAEHRNLKSIKLEPTEDNTFSGDIFFMSEVAFKKDENGSISAFTVGNGRTKGILFTKQ
ncbi:MAG: beta-lactamase family protein, partial [Flavobacteriaceae bacterium]|nr:beta-lactamase family protein [Flavobacteriaceae bacterium]